MASGYRHRPPINKAFLRHSPTEKESAGTSETVEGVLDAFRQFAAEKEIDLFGLKLSYGDLEQDPTFADAGTGDAYKVTIQLHLRKEDRVENRSEPTPPAIEGIVGKSEAIQQVVRLIYKVAAATEPTLISGESGTGKELVARAIHDNSSRAKEPFIAINCAEIAATLTESLLFGHEKGAFTGAIAQHKGFFEQAGAGTLFLDEIGELEFGLQAKLLRVLQERTFRRLGGKEDLRFNGRIIAASNRNLHAESIAGRFRFDLYQRFCVLEINLPPLRKRGDDLFLIVNHEIKKLNLEKGKQILGLTPEVADLFRRYHWPGNVRELNNTLARAVTFEDGNLITTAYLPPVIKALMTEIEEQLPPGSSEIKESRFIGDSKVEWPQPAGNSGTEDMQSSENCIEYLMVLQDGEPIVKCFCRALLAVYQQAREGYGDHTAVARRLGVNRMTLWDWLKNAERGRLIINSKD